MNQNKLSNNTNAYFLNHLDVSSTFKIIQCMLVSFLTVLNKLNIYSKNILYFSYIYQTRILYIVKVTTH